MSLLERAAAHPARPSRTCEFRADRKLLSPEDDADLTAMLSDERKYPARVIVETLAEVDISVSLTTIKVHRRGECKTCRA